MIYSIGEALIDIFGDGPAERRAGGASAAFCTAVSSLGGNAALIARLGGDSDGAFLLRALKNADVNTDYVFIDRERGTGRVVISRLGSAFCLRRKSAADMFLSPDDIPDGLFKKGDALHFCSMGLIESAAKYAHIRAVKAASAVGAAVAFDLNFRPKQWTSPEECVHAVEALLTDIDYFKASEEELGLLCPAVCGESAARALLERSAKLKCVIITSGAGPTAAYLKDNRAITAPLLRADTVDATGAGDCFFGAFLLNMEKLGALSAAGEAYSNGVSASLEYASAAAALSSERPGAFCTVRHADVEKRLRTAKPTSDNGGN